MKKTMLTLILTTLLTFPAAGLAAAPPAIAANNQYTPVASSPDTHPSYLVTMFSEQGKRYVIADYIQWFEGKAADQIFQEREPDAGMPSPPNGYYIVNDNTKLRTLEVSGDAEVLMQPYNPSGSGAGAEIQWNQPLSLSEFETAISKDPLLLEYPYHLVVHDDQVVKIIQQYIP